MRKCNHSLTVGGQGRPTRKVALVLCCEVGSRGPQHWGCMGEGALQRVEGE